jgi:hypothetical protein
MVGVRDAGRANTGQPNFELAPDPTALRTFIAPPCSRTISRVVASLNPLPVARVVKNGSKIRPRAASSMPLPVSLTTTHIWRAQVQPHLLTPSQHDAESIPRQAGF